jgi:hypothetical protein
MLVKRTNGPTYWISNKVHLSELVDNGVAALATMYSCDLEQIASIVDVRWQRNKDHVIDLP